MVSRWVGESSPWRAGVSSRWGVLPSIHRRASQEPPPSRSPESISKRETAKQLPTEADIRAWVAATRSSESVESELLGLLAAARIEYVTHRDESCVEGGLATVQRQHAALESQTTHIAEWQPAMVPGLVQTAAYTRELLERPDRPTMTEDVDPEAIKTLLGQLDRLVAVSDLPTVELGIVAFPMMPVMPLSSFSLHDDAVYIETLTGEQQLYEPDEVTVYSKAFELLRAASLTGPDAVVLIQRIATKLRRST
jgi:Domain of unknown function (DUF5753)